MFIVVFLENILPVHMRRQSDPVSIVFTPTSDINATFRSFEHDIRLHLPAGALDLPSESQLNLTVSVINLTASPDGVPQFIGAIKENVFENSSRVNLDPYAAIYVSAHVTDFNPTAVKLKRPGYLYVPAMLDKFSAGQLFTWLYNERNGIWQRTSATALEEQMLVLEISQFGWWSVAVNWTDTSCTSVSVTRSSSASRLPSPLTGSVVWLMGTDNSYSSVRGTDAAGKACLERKSDSPSLVIVQHDQFGVDSGLIFIARSNRSACNENERWLHGTATQATCSSLEILCEYSRQIVESWWLLCVSLV